MRLGIFMLMGLPMACFAQGVEAPRLVLRNAMITEAQMGGSAAIAAEVYNPTSITLTITGAASPVAEQTLMQSYAVNAAGVKEVHALKQLTIPGKGSAALEPGKLELRLLGLKEDLHAGNELPLLVKTDKGQSQVMRVEIIKGYAN